MPTPPKASAAMQKHLSDAELKARQEAEQQTMPDRGGNIKLKKPRLIAKNKTANSYWNQIVKRMDGLAILDDLDSEMLAGYCSMLVQLGVQGALEADVKKAPAKMSDAEWEDSGRTNPPMTPDELIEAVSKLDTLTGKLQSLERNLLQYADKLGLTPTGRVRLAQKRAEQASGKAAEPEDDLYGD